ncbi:MAG: DUF3810 domain-containing protein [Eubacteriales bacterium]|nr:DUF3810 domain-containing protein [Eubacteriales bacterium]
MLKILSTISSYKKPFGFSAVCFVLSFTLITLSRTTEGFAQWYAVNVYPFFSITIGKAFSALDFSFFEISSLILVPLIGVFALAGISMILRQKPFGRIRYGTWFRLFSGYIAFMVLAYTMTCAINYSRDSIGTVLNLPDQEASEENLIKLSLILAEELTSLTQKPEWDYSILTAESAAYIETKAVNAMKMIGKRESSLAGYYPEPKPVYFSKFLSNLGIEGIFSPFTMEANYNNDMTAFLIPYTICHELAHFKGYMKEEDAGFIAYLACRNSPSLVFQYSGLFHGLTYTLNTLRSQAPSVEYNEIYQALPEPIRVQLQYVKEQNLKRTSLFTSASKTVNNLYLKANAQAGTKSYGRVVDLLISDYADRINEEGLL